MSLPPQPPVPGQHNERKVAERAVTRIMNDLPVGVNSRLSGKKFNYVSGLLIEIPTGSGSKLAPAVAHYDGYGLRIICPRRWPGASRHAPQPVTTNSAPLPPEWQKGKAATWPLDLRNDEHQFVLLRFLEHCPLPVDVKVAMAWFSPPCTWVCRRQRMNNKKGFDLAPVVRVCVVCALEGH